MVFRGGAEIIFCPDFSYSEKPIPQKKKAKGREEKPNLGGNPEAQQKERR